MGPARPAGVEDTVSDATQTPARYDLRALWDYLDQHGLALVRIEWDGKEFVAIVREKNG